MKSLIHHFFSSKIRREVKRFLSGAPRICPQLYAWAKDHPEYVDIIKEHWGPHRRIRNLPKVSGGEEIPNCFLENTEYPLYEKTLFRFRNLTMRGADGILFLPDGSVSHQTAWAIESIIVTDVYKKPWKGKKVFKKGNYSTLILYWGLAYYHWFNDVLSLLHGNLKLMPEDTIFILPKGFGGTFEDNIYLKTLEALGIDEKKIVEFDETESWTFENFWWQPPAVHPDDQTPGAMQWIGQQIVQSIPIGQAEKPVWIYISRALPSARVIANEEELLPGLLEMGFQICHLEKMPFEEQVRLFQNAEMVVGPHGAGFTNLIFSKPGTRVVEILAKGYERRCYWTLSSELGHDYRFYLGQPKFPERKGEPDIQVNAEQLLSALKRSIECL